MILRWRIARLKVRQRRFHAWRWRCRSIFLARLPDGVLRSLRIPPLRRVELGMIRQLADERVRILHGPHPAFLPPPLSIGPSASDLQVANFNAKLEEQRRDLESVVAEFRVLTGVSR